MHRRHFLAALGTAGVAGCLGGSPDGGGGTATPATPARPTLESVDLPVPRSEMRAAVPRDHIPAVVEPAFGPSWDGVSVDGQPLSLPDEDAVIGIRRGGSTRAYPLRILNHHEVVNDRFGGPLLVTYCVLCGSAVAAERFVAGDPTVFGVSGYLWRSDLVMYDRATDSLWSQLLATAIRGPRTGHSLSLVPASLTTWGAWRREHESTDVLLPPPHSNTVRGRNATFDYRTPAYDYADEDQLIGLDSYDGRLHPKTLVIGIARNGRAAAYPFPVVSEAGVVNDAVGGVPVVVTVTPAGSLVAYERRVDGEALTFRPGDPAHLVGGGSRWTRETGRAVDGPHVGRQLEAATDVPAMFWFGWSRFHPDTRVYGVEARPSG